MTTEFVEREKDGYSICAAKDRPRGVSGRCVGQSSSSDRGRSKAVLGLCLGLGAHRNRPFLHHTLHTYVPLEYFLLEVSLLGCRPLSFALALRPKKNPSIRCTLGGINVGVPNHARFLLKEGAWLILLCWSCPPPGIHPHGAQHLALLQSAWKMTRTIVSVQMSSIMPTLRIHEL